ncbi:ferripyochelin binding protein, putative [Heliomicrobium modesticaldum Ice1]|uniref:Ferripyochelin binding protein, putative n=1 Tax=Heliobacterium modesticaldum (strain ATCC 51547 / Ice1) TaxID=498761 RepID=B0TAG5_HELMI|nr:gamma carbonic anhydrase family protein [Heliomicrobium modesticaldum]ABZ85015.1 ferripyochelin binding protein, putative [Heliomicrobium modesticaldum Ice1]
MPIFRLGSLVPQIDPDSFIAPSAIVGGDVIVKKGASLWFHVVARGDVGQPIIVGENSNIQDNTVLHTDAFHPTEIGDWVTVGHGAIIHSARVGDHCLIGMGAVLLDGAVIGEHSVVGAHALVPPGKEFPPYSLIVGSPAKVARTLTPEEAERFKGNARRYVTLWQEQYKQRFHWITPPGSLFPQEGD